MEHTGNHSDANQESDLEAFQEKILAKCQIYRSAKNKDVAKQETILQELETDFSARSKSQIKSVIESHKQEISESAAKIIDE